jgi:hypothetical protein
MKRFNVFQQLPPIPQAVYTNRKQEKELEYHLHLKKVGEVRAHSGAHAIDVARERFSCFTHFTVPTGTLASFPIVEAV